MATVFDYLGSAVDWHTVHCMPIVEALFERDEPRVRATLAQCREQLTADQALSADERRALEFTLAEYDIALVNAFYGDVELGEQFAQTQAQLEELPPLGPLSDRVLAKVQLALIGIGTRRGFIVVDAARLRGILARIPEEFRTPNIWYYVVAWAFPHDDLELLEQALEHQTVETTGWNDDYYWLRTNLMYQLVRGTAARLDIEKTIRGYRHPRHIADFRNLFLTRCESAGLMDSGLLALLEQREAELDPLQASSPERVPKTAHVVKLD
jgi:hypothetical protein